MVLVLPVKVYEAFTPGVRNSGRSHSTPVFWAELSLVISELAATARMVIIVCMCVLRCSLLKFCAVLYFDVIFCVVMCIDLLRCVVLCFAVAVGSVLLRARGHSANGNYCAHAACSALFSVENFGLCCTLM